MRSKIFAPASLPRLGIALEVTATATDGFVRTFVRLLGEVQLTDASNEEGRVRGESCGTEFLGEVRLLLSRLLRPW